MMGRTHPVTLSAQNRKPAARRALGCSLGGLALAGALACDSGLDRYSEVRDLRVLAVRVQPPEVFLPEQGPFDIAFEALVVNPAGSEVSYQWSFCPVESQRACRDFEPLRDGASAGHQAALDTLRALGASQAGTATPSADEARGPWEYDIPAFTLTAVPESLYAFHRDTTAFGLGFGAWPSAIIEVQAGGQSLTTQKRFVFLGDPSDMLRLIYRVETCEPGQDPTGMPPCVPFLPTYGAGYTPNLNPFIAKAQIARTELATATFVDPPDDLVLEPEESIRILPVLAKARPTEPSGASPPEEEEEYEPETYDVVRTDLQTGRFEIDRRTEEISVSWFASAGTLQDELTWALWTRSLDTVYTAPDEPPEGADGRVAVWMVARDQRGGTDWHRLELRVVSP